MLEILIHHICDGKDSVDKIRGKGLGHYIREQLSYEELTNMDLLCPDEIKLGKRFRKSFLYRRASTVSNWSDSRVLWA